LLTGPALTVPALLFPFLHIIIPYSRLRPGRSSSREGEPGRGCSPASLFRWGYPFRTEGPADEAQRLPGRPAPHPAHLRGLFVPGDVLRLADAQQGFPLLLSSPDEPVYFCWLHGIRHR